MEGFLRFQITWDSSPTCTRASEAKVLIKALLVTGVVMSQPY